MQSPSGFPDFHTTPPPAGPAIAASSSWSPPERLSGEDGGGYRPQIAAGPDGTLHALYYRRADQGDLIQHRRRTSGSWTDAVRLGFETDRNWGPDIVARDDGSVVVSFDHMRMGAGSRGWLTIWDSASGWSSPTPLTSDDPQGEVGSGHIAHGSSADLAYVWIGKKMSPEHRFVAYGMWGTATRWGAPTAFTDGSADAWHTNVERRPDGSVLAGWDVGTGGRATVLYVVDGRDGRWGEVEDITANGQPGERPHFAFGDQDHITWFHKQESSPIAVYTRSGHPGAWGPVQEPSAGFGGYHFDPDIAINADGTRCLVWGWDGGDDAELVYSLDRGQGWEAPRKLADIDWGKPGLPSIAVDGEGVFHVVWNQGIKGENHVYYAYVKA